MTLVVVPLRVTDDHRLRAWQFVLDRLSTEQFVVATGDVAGDWCKARAVAAALRHSWPHDGVLVIHDADVWCQPTALRAAIDACARGAPWAVPHREVHRYDERSTAELLDAGHHDAPQLVRWPYVGIAGGGITVVRAEVYDDCPLDPRFIGWGSEDECFGWALGTLYGEPWRGDAPLVHLWHPHALPGARRSPRWESARLHRAYRAYRRNPAAMRELVTAARATTVI